MEVGHDLWASTFPASRSVNFCCDCLDLGLPSLFAEALSQESPRAAWEFPKIGVPYFGDLIITI